MMGNNAFLFVKTTEATYCISQQKKKSKSKCQQPFAVTWLPPIFFCSAESVVLPRATFLPWEPMRHLSHVSVCCRESSSIFFKRLLSMEIRGFLLGFFGLFCICSSLSAQSTCKLKAKFNLNGYKDVEKKKVVIGGMFPVHKRIASSDGNTSRVPVSSGCEGWAESFETSSLLQLSLFRLL